MKESEDRKEAVKEVLLNNIGIKLGSILVALIVWMIIINIDDPYKTRTFSVSVQTINEDALKSVNKVYEIIEGSTANVKVKGKKSVVDKLNADDISATADLSDLSSVNAVAIVPVLNKHVSSEVTLECNQVLKVALENMAKKQVKISIETVGTPEEGYTIGKCIAKPNMIEVMGGQSTIEQIESVKVVLNVNGISGDFSRKLRPAAYDENGNEVKSSTLSYSVDRVKVVAELLENKRIPVNIKVKGNPAEGYDYVETSCLPEEIDVAGSSKALAKISELTIPVDITGMTSLSSKLEQNIVVSEYLPEGVTALEENATLSIKITIEPHITKVLQIKTSDIRILSLKDGYSAEIVDKSDVVNIRVSGRASVMSSLKAESVSAYVNCDGLEEGTYNLKVLMSIGESYTIENNGRVKVRIRKNDSKKDVVPETTKEPEVTATPEPTNTPEDDVNPPEEDDNTGTEE